MKKKYSNYAFIDVQNIQLGIKQQGWKLDWQKFHTYLTKRHFATKIYLFLGYIPSYKKRYENLAQMGYILIFKEVTLRNKTIKGNVDVELAVKTMIELPNFGQAIIVTSDGDFAYLVDYLYQLNKLYNVLGTSKKRTSIFLKKVARGRITYLDLARKFIQEK